VLALMITSSQAEEQFLESSVMGLITLYSGLDQEKLPPIAGFETGADRVTWTKSRVKSTLKELLNSYVSLIQIENTRGASRIEVDDIYEQGFYDSLFLENNASFDNISASFIFLDWPIHFDITPSLGESLEPSSYRREFQLGIISPIETNHYEFFYDAAYPVVVELRGDDALNGEGFSFLFALEGNVRDNRNPLEWHIGKGTIGEWDYDRVTLELREGLNPEYVVGFDSLTNKTINQTFNKPKKSLICDYNQRIGSNISIQVFNAKNKVPMSKASVTFGCGKYKTCSLGSTDNSGFFEAQMPVCIGSYIRIDKEGYLSSIIGNISSLSGNSKEFEVELEQMRRKKASAKILPLSMVNKSRKITAERASAMHDNAYPLKDNENIFVTLKRVKKFQFEQGFFQSILLDNTGKQDMMLVPGNYSVQANFIDNNGVYIRGRNEFIGDELIKYPPMNMTPAMLGNIRIDDTTGGFWEVTSADLEKGYVTFYVIRIDDPETVEDFEQFSRFDEYSFKYREVLLPEFS